MSPRPRLVEVEGPPPGYHVGRKRNYYLIVGGVLLATAGAALTVAGFVDNFPTNTDYDDQPHTSSTDVNGERLLVAGLGVGGVGALLIVLGATTGEQVYVPNRVASVSVVPVVGKDRAGGALRLTF